MEVSEIMSWIGSVLAMTAVVQGVLPREYRDYVIDRVIQVASPYTYFLISEFDGNNVNEFYVSVQCYLSGITSERARVSHIAKHKNAKKFSFSLATNQRIRDTFDKLRVEWLHNSKERKNPVWMNNFESSSDEQRSFQLKMPRAHKDYVLNNYFPYITEQAKLLSRGNRDLNLYSNKKIESYGRKGGWSCIPFRHPASFDTIAMDPELKISITGDLDDFLTGEEFYRRVGKSWKRGYLLYGPPGTGKTSVIAAMANKLRYDVYDLELTEVQSNADLRKLLLDTADKSIIVIEDIDCSLDLSGQRKKKKSTKKDEDDSTTPSPLRKPDDSDKPSKVTLSGLLNFTDGLWSCCGSERIFVFTTNYINKLDPALVRAGRMDMHINLSYCTFPAFKTLAKNFLQIHDHSTFPEVEQLFDGNFVTPAEIAEILTKHRRQPDTAMERVVEALRDRKSKPPPPPEEAEDDEDEDHDETKDETEAKAKVEKPDEPIAETTDQ